MVVLDQAVPEFSLPMTGDDLAAQTQFTLSAYRGRAVVIYFYPRDNTSCCTTEALDFSALHDEFTAAGAFVLGISRDKLSTHANFCRKQSLPFALGADVDEAVCQLFEVMKMKTMYGKQVRGIERSTFLIDADGVLRREWRKVRTAGHAQAVLDAVRALHN